ncbi:hypothetical protein LTR78_000633 [Recurvomyces mirabilis]|uniref:AMP-dependent synthetase/ligase domain-containing protein n=1 Tax=Recurvomyces mirabilis TaxID=574656 RepID=A0AAE1C6M2_9PEZI|nr:hypothetical protein LTR78_000633 [Recurvomyces mirabilis]KAK5162287.1 hypothetical protein LTS14_000634 [Recurvomyces mirabilis]
MAGTVSFKPINGRSEVYGGPYETHLSLYASIEQGLKTNPDGIAVVVKFQPANHLASLAGINEKQDEVKDEGLVWTRSQFHRAGLTLAGALLANGTKPGTTIITLVTNGVETELENFLVAMKADTVVVGDEKGAAAVDTALQSSSAPVPSVRITLTDTTVLPSPWKPLSNILQAVPLSEPDKVKLLQAARTYDPDRIALIVFTSGTSSGKPKGCLRHEGSMAGWAANFRWREDWGSKDSIILTTSNFRIIATFMSLTLWIKGSTLVMPSPVFEPGKLLEAVEKHRVNTLLLLPAQFYAVTSHPTFKQRDLSSLQAVSTGADMITRTLLSDISAAFPSADITVSHGMSEGGGYFAWKYWGTSFSELPYYNDIAPLGRVAEGARLRLWDAEKGVVPNVGGMGEIHTCNEATLKHYLGGLHEDSFYEDEYGRWFKTGDLGLISEDGTIYILGRNKDIIKRAGVPITAAPLESSLSSFVESPTAIIPITSPTPGVGQEPFAIVQDLKAKTEQQLKQHVLDLFGKDYALAGAASLAQLGLKAFPLNATGKVQKLDLLAALERSGRAN